MLQVGRAILVSRGAHGDQQQVSVCHANGGINREAQAAAGQMALDQRGQPRLIEGDLPQPEGGDPLVIHIHAADLMAHLGQNSGLHQPDIACAKNGDLHEKCLVL